MTAPTVGTPNVSIFVEVFVGNIVRRHFAGLHFSLVRIERGFYSCYDLSFVKLAFLNEFLHAFGTDIDSSR